MTNYNDAQAGSYNSIFTAEGLSERQFVLDYGSSDALLVGEGTDFPFMFIEGLDETPEIRTFDTPRASAHGLTSGTDWYGERVIRLGLGVVGEFGSSEYREKLDLLKKSSFARTGDIDVLYRFNNTEARLIHYRPRRMRVETDPETYALGLSTVVLEMYCCDPFIYAPSETVISVPLGGGIDGSGNIATGIFGFGYNGSAANSALAVNYGNAATYPIIRITGSKDISLPKIWVEDRTPARKKSGDFINSTASIQYLATLGQQQVLTLNHQNHTVVVNGASGYSKITAQSKFWGLSPGENRISFTSFNPQNLTGSCTVTYRSAWI